MRGRRWRLVAAAVTALALLVRQDRLEQVAAAATRLIKSEVRNEAAARREHLIGLGADEAIVDGLVRLARGTLDGVVVTG